MLIKKIYLGQTQIRPDIKEKTVEYTNIPMGSSISAQEAGLKIKQVTFEAAGYYSGSDWKNGGMNLYDDVSVRTNLHVNIQLGGTWGYDYGTYGAYNGYGVERTNQTTQAIIKGNSSGGNSHNFYIKMITTVDQTEYKFGTSSTSIGQQGTATHNATVKQWITDLFNGTNLQLSRNAWSNQNYFTSYKVTIVYGK